MKYVDKLGKFHLYILTRLIILFLLIAICRTARTRNKLAKKDMTEKQVKQVIITAIGQCHGDEGLPINVVPMNIIREGRFDYYIDGVVFVREDFDDGFEVKFTVLRCDQREIIETCTSVLNYVNSSQICELLERRVDAYTHALEQIQPRPLCPLKQGSYLLSHLPTDDSFLKYMPNDDFSFFWNVEITGMKDGKRIMCFDLEFHTNISGDIRVLKNDACALGALAISTYQPVNKCLPPILINQRITKPFFSKYI